MSVLITGASGFIGTNVLKLLTPDQQKDVYCLTRKLTADQKKVYPSVNWVQGDIADKGILVTPIVYPAVGRSKCRFRFTVSSEHTKPDMDLALEVLAEAFLLVEGQGNLCAQS